MPIEIYEEIFENFAHFVAYFFPHVLENFNEILKFSSLDEWQTFFLHFIVAWAIKQDIWALRITWWEQLAWCFQDSLV